MGDYYIKFYSTHGRLIKGMKATASCYQDSIEAGNKQLRVVDECASFTVDRRVYNSNGVDFIPPTSLHKFNNFLNDRQTT